MTFMTFMTSMTGNLRSRHAARGACHAWWPKRVRHLSTATRALGGWLSSTYPAWD